MESSCWWQGDATGIAVCAVVHSSLSLASEIGVNIDTITGELDSAEAVPDMPAGVWHVPSVLGAETVVHRCIEICIAGVRVFFATVWDVNDSGQLVRVTVKTGRLAVLICIQKKV